MANWLTGTIVKKTQWDDRLFSLHIASDFNEFEPGQFIRVALDVNGERVARPYSLVNTPLDAELEIYFNIVSAGPLTPALAKLEVGDEIFVAERATGFLTVSELPACSNLWMLATGTGIGPFISILKSDLVWQRFSKIILGYSVRCLPELSYRSQIAEIEEKYPDKFVFVPFVTRESVEGAVCQRIPSSIKDGSLEKRVDVSIDTDSHIMLCGNSDMISEVTECLNSRGLRKHLRREAGHITIEKYH